MPSVSGPLANIRVSYCRRMMTCSVRVLVNRRDCSGVRMSESGPDSIATEGATALGLLEEALEMLDRFDAPAEIGAHVDLAIERLRDVLERTGPLAPRPNPRE
jgi:hypothetical protein